MFINNDVIDIVDIISFIENQVCETSMNRQRPSLHCVTTTHQAHVAGFLEPSRLCCKVHCAALHPQNNLSHCVELTAATMSCVVPHGPLFVVAFQVTGSELRSLRMQVFGTESLVPGKLQSRTCVAATKVKLLALHAGDVFPLAPWCSKVTLERQLARDVLCTVLQSTLSLQDMSDELDDLERVTFQQGELLAAQNQARISLSDYEASGCDALWGLLCSFWVMEFVEFCIGHTSR